MIEGFNIKEQVLGTGDTLSYTFDFKIYEATDLFIWVQDGSGNIVQKIRGDDTTFLASLVFDADEGGGTVTLIADLPDTYVMTMFLAPDAPDQPTAFPNKTSFSMDAIEGALDFLASCIQRVAYLAQRAVVLHDLDDIDSFDPTLPLGVGDNPGGIVSVKDDGSGFEIAVTTGMIASAQGYAVGAAASAAAAVISATAAAASAVSAAASAALALAGYFVSGSRGAPLGITAAGGITPASAQRNLQFIHGSPGAVTITANPQIAAGTVIGQECTLIGTDDTNTVKFTNGNGLVLNGDITLTNDDTISFFWDGTNWCELYRR